VPLGIITIGTELFYILHKHFYTRKTSPWCSGARKLNTQEKLTFPIDDYEKEIVRTICANQVTIIDADTGSGKTTRVAPMLLENTDYNIVVTNPRRLSTMSAATYVAGQMNTEIGGDVIGYCTALSRKISKNTRCPFATDGLQLVRELTLSKQTLSTGVVLIIDEIHEWNLNIETLVAWVRTSSLFFS
jgi:HrpA-like RNA helicase